MIYLGADHRGFQLKEDVKKFLAEQEIGFEDLGNQIYDANDDYTDVGKMVAQKVGGNLEENRGILICGSGIGMSIVANRFKGIRAGICLTEWMVEHGRTNEDINVLVLASEIINLEMAKLIINKFLNTEFIKKDNYLRRKVELDQ
jgi:ribose 5-phosphate isomerase B